MAAVNIFKKYVACIESLYLNRVQSIVDLFDERSIMIGSAISEFGYGKDEVRRQHEKAFEECKILKLIPDRIMSITEKSMAAVCKLKLHDPTGVEISTIENIRISIVLNDNNKILCMHTSLPDQSAPGKAFFL
jgi:hypothetical protein